MSMRSPPFPARIILILVGLAISVISSKGLADQPLVFAAPTACMDGQQASGATYRICMPTTWNGKLLVYAHGYVSPTQPLGIPEEQMVLPGTTTRIDQVVNGQGY